MSARPASPERGDRPSAGDRVYASPDAVDAFIRRLLAAHGVREGDAAVVAACLLKADLRGVDTHGLVRLPIYLERLRRGLVNPRPSLAPERVTPVAAALDGQDGLGFVVATRAMAEAIAMARELGVGIVAARRSTHFGMAACYALQAADAGLVSLVFTNASPAMPPWGGRKPLLGTSPLAAGAPAGRHPAVVLDMSVTVGARGKLRRAARRGEDIPPGYALDAEGRPTTDPAAALEGVLLPVGGPKGSGLAVMMDVFSGVISGAAYAGGVGNQYVDFDRPQDVGHFFLAMRPSLFVPEADYLARIEALVERIKASPRAQGFDEILLPGEREACQEELRRRSGLPYTAGEVAPLQDEARRAGVDGLPVSDRPLSAPEGP